MTGVNAGRMHIWLTAGGWTGMQSHSGGSSVGEQGGIRVICSPLDWSIAYRHSHGYPIRAHFEMSIDCLPQRWLPFIHKRKEIG